MHDLAFADATRPTPAVILRLPLRDYSIGHEVLLLRRRNPLLTLSPAQFDFLPIQKQCFAIQQAVLTCCNTWEQNNQPHRWLRLWGWKIRRANYPLAIVDFRNYLAEGTTAPPGPSKDADDICSAGRGDKEDKDGRELGSPYLARLYQFICSLPASEKSAYGSAWDFPYGLANWLYMTALEDDSRVKIENALELQVREEMAGHLAELEREKAAAKDAKPETPDPIT